MRELNESILQSIGWLAYLPSFPVPGILLGCVAAFAAILGSLRYINAGRSTPIWRQGWVWVSLTVVVVLIYVAVAFAFVAADDSPVAAAGLIAWWVGPVVVVLFSISEAARSRRRILRTAHEQRTSG